MGEERIPCEECNYKEVLAHGSSPVERRERLWSVKLREKKREIFTWELVQGERQQDLDILWGYRLAHKSKRICDTCISVQIKENLWYLD